MNRTCLLLFIASTFIAFVPSLAQLPEEVVAAANERLENKPGTGMIIGVIKNGNIEYHSFNGPEAQDDIIEPTTIIETGSITKVFTALIAAQMIEEGALNLNNPIGAYLPDDVTTPEVEGIPINVFDVLNHTSGLPRLPDHLESEDEENPFKGYTADDAYEFLNNFELEREPGTGYGYSHIGYALMGLALEHTTGKSYAELLKKRILDPLNMESTWVKVPEAQRHRMAAPHFEEDNVPYWEMDAFEAAAAVTSTPSDLMLFLSAHLGMIPHEMEGAMSLATAAMNPTDLPFTSIGLGWLITNTPKATVVWQDGATAGFRCFIGFDRGQNIGVVAAVNNGAVNPTDLGMRIMDPDREVMRYPENIEITHELLAPYEGTYRISDDFEIEIIVRDDRIYAQATGQDRFRIYPETTTTFNYHVTVASIEFHKDMGDVTGLTLKQNQEELYGKKVE